MPKAGRGHLLRLAQSAHLQHRLNPPLILPNASRLLPPQKTLLNYGPALQRHKYCRQTANVWHLKPRPYLLHFSCLWLPPNGA